MVNITIDGTEIDAGKGSSILDAARSHGIDIPALCYHEDVTPYGACRLCTVEVEERGKTKLVASCLYPVKEGLKVRTETPRVVNGRRMILELLLARCPDSETLQEMALKMGVKRVRFKTQLDDCILCGLCIRMCTEQMGSVAVGFIGRGDSREIVTPFRESSEMCSSCGVCKWICPARNLTPEDLVDG